MQRGQRVRVIKGPHKGKLGTFAYIGIIPMSSLKGINMPRPNPKMGFIIDLDDGTKDKFSENALEEID